MRLWPGRLGLRQNRGRADVDATEFDLLTDQSRSETMLLRDDRNWNYWRPLQAEESLEEDAHKEPRCTLRRQPEKKSSRDRWFGLPRTVWPAVCRPCNNGQSKGPKSSQLSATEADIDFCSSVTMEEYETDAFMLTADGRAVPAEPHWARKSVSSRMEDSLHGMVGRPLATFLESC